MENQNKPDMMKIRALHTAVDVLHKISQDCHEAADKALAEHEKKFNRPSFINNQKLVSLTPIFTTFIFEMANIGQLYEMWTKRSAEGQSIFSWCIISLALLLWFNFYRIKTPDEKFAIWSTVAALITNLFVIFSVVYFKFIV